jgi:hypothetical protein
MIFRQDWAGFPAIALPWDIAPQPFGQLRVGKPATIMAATMLKNLWPSVERASLSSHYTIVVAEEV